MQWVMQRYYGPFITRKRAVHVVVMLAFGGLAIMSGVGITKINQGLPIVDLTPNDHYARDFLVNVQQHWLGFAYTNNRILFRHGTPLANGAST